MANVPGVALRGCSVGGVHSANYFMVILVNTQRYLLSESIHVGVDDHEHKGNNQVEDEPDVNHLDV